MTLHILINLGVENIKFRFYIELDLCSPVKMPAKCRRWVKIKKQRKIYGQQIFQIL
jgi:hypothetical protein